MKYIKSLILTAIALFVSVPYVAYAHVKWFVESDEVKAASHGMPFYNVTSVEVYIWAALVFLAVLIFSVLDLYIKTPKKLLAFAYAHEKGIVRASQIILGLFLVSVSLLWNIILVPEFHVVGMFAEKLRYVQIAIGLAFIFNILPRLAAGILALLLVIVGYVFGYVAVLENAILLSLAIFFFIKNSPADSWWNRADKHAVEIVRIGTAVTLITLAFTEKLMYPELSMSFLSVHHWNFMQGIFPWFTDKLFVLSTGFAELAFGIIFIFGYLTRINTLLISGFFAASVVTMGIQFGAWEVEDLVVYSAAILFAFFGHGRTKFFHAVWPKSFLHKKLIQIKVKDAQTGDRVIDDRK